MECTLLHTSKSNGPTAANQGCALTASAPPEPLGSNAPSRLDGSASSNARTMSHISCEKVGGRCMLPALDCTMFEYVAGAEAPWNGLYPASSSYKSTPRAHQSTSKPWPLCNITSGARYAGVLQTQHGNQDHNLWCSAGGPPVLSFVLLVRRG